MGGIGAFACRDRKFDDRAPSSRWAPRKLTSLVIEGWVSGGRDFAVPIAKLSILDREAAGSRSRGDPIRIARAVDPDREAFHS
jgi:hypothetical protein